MFNLLMAGHGGYWDEANGTDVFDENRYLEYTHRVLKEKYSNLSDEILAELMSFPTLFAYETGIETPARVGWIRAIRRRNDGLEIDFDYDDQFDPIPPDIMQELWPALDFKKNEKYRSHWAVKEVDLFAVLADAGLVDLSPPAPPEAEASKPRVFVVHGRDEAMKEAVARVLERFGLEVIILHERPNKGRTIISKFREEAEGVEFALVLMSPDDFGALHGEEPSPRARQNVILELGFFLGAIGPDRVCALVNGNMDTPTDYDGVVYISYDGGGGGWRLAVARELTAIGIPIQADRLLD